MPQGPRLDHVITSAWQSDQWSNGWLSLTQCLHPWHQCCWKCRSRKSTSHSGGS